MSTSPSIRSKESSESKAELLYTIGTLRPRVQACKIAKGHLRNDVFWCDEIDVVYLSDLLKFHHPVSKFFCSKVEPFSLMGNVMVLTEDASQIATREENTATSVVALYARLLAEVRANDIHFDAFGANEAVASPLMAIHATEPWAQIAMAQMSISYRFLARDIRGGK
jgi:hypothetical protein